MVDWESFKKNIFSHKVNLDYQLLEIDHDNQIGVFYEKKSTTLYFGFIRNSNSENLEKLISDLDNFAHQNRFLKVVGPIDGATWNNYRFQSQIEISQSYLGQPSYEPKMMQMFLKHGFRVSEVYETIQIDQIKQVEQSLNSFRDIPLPQIRFVRPTSMMLETHKIEIHHLLNGIFSDNLEFHKISNEEIELVFSHIKKMINYDVSVLAFNDKNQIVGFMLNYIVADTLFFKTIGFLKEYRFQGLSIFKMLNFLFDQIHKDSKLDLHKAIICLMKKGNFPSLISSDSVSQKNQYVLLEKTYEPH